jgi:serine/threonine protein kinase
LKVLKQGEGRYELNVLKYIRAGDVVVPDFPQSNVVQLLDDFEHVSESGTYLCLVLELMWQDIQAFVKGLSDEARVIVVKAMSRQIIAGVSYLHGVGIIHNGTAKIPMLKLTGDLHPMNFLVGFGTQDLSVEELVAMSLPVEDPSDAYEDYRWDGKLVRVYDSQPITLSDGATISPDSMIVKIADFGLGTSLKGTILIASMLY